jgi:LysM repeat protein
VKSGDSLWTIARAYGCEADRLTEVNRLDGNLIKPGQELRIPRCSGASFGASSADKKKKGKSKKSSALREHLVVSGDTLGHIAKIYGSSVEDIQARNSVKGTTIFPGQTLRVLPGAGGKGRFIIGQSVGSANGGKLVNGTKLPNGRAYYIRREHRAYGANHTIFHIRRVADRVRRRFKKIHRLAIGDISDKDGGKITMHSSHQSGRDVDLGFYFNKKPKKYPKEFVVATAKNIHAKATWTMLKALADTADSPHGVERMFISYSTQKLLYQQAVKAGVKERDLARVFQYPHGESANRGLIRHEPGHDEHVHVRFKCPANDKSCR